MWQRGHADELTDKQESEKNSNMESRKNTLIDLTDEGSCIKNLLISLMPAAVIATGSSDGKFSGGKSGRAFMCDRISMSVAPAYHLIEQFEQRSSLRTALANQQHHNYESSLSDR
jgi:hypothetical protein